MHCHARRRAHAGVILPLLRSLPGCLHAISTPILILHGEADGRVPPSHAQDLGRGIGSADKTLKIYEGMRHQLLQACARA